MKKIFLNEKQKKEEWMVCKDYENNQSNNQMNNLHDNQIEKENHDKQIENTVEDESNKNYKSKEIVLINK